MNNSAYILLTISLIIGFVSLVISSRKSGFIVPYRLSFKGKYRIDKSKIEDYSRMMALIAAGNVVFGLFISQDIRIVLEFTLLNLCFIGYALAWQKIIIKVKSKTS